MLDHDVKALFELDGDHGPARPIGGGAADAIVSGALAGAGFAAAGAGVAGAAAARAAARPMLKLLLGGLATAVVGAAIVLAVVARGGGDDRAPPANPVVAIVPPAPAPAIVVPDAPEPVEVAEPAEPDEIEMPGIDARPMTTHEVADLLAQANAKRAAKAWRAADALYTRVARGAPKTLAAQTALVASASLHLEHLGDARGAARKYRAALAAGGPLAEDARWGIVEAVRSDPKAERAALDDFLAHHGGSPLAPAAKARRAALDP